MTSLLHLNITAGLLLCMKLVGRYIVIVALQTDEYLRMPKNIFVATFLWLRKCQDRAPLVVSRLYVTESTNFSQYGEPAIGLGWCAVVLDSG